jgi:GTP-dependent phosphoenolpyruvate carboxykinase
MVDVHAALGGAGLRNVHVREYVRYWAELTGAERIEVISTSDDARLLGEALADGEILPAGEGRYYSRSYVKDTARSEERTVVATSNPADKGVYNNWRPAGEMRPLVEERMRGASVGRTMYVVPYLMAPAGSPLERYAAGVELTDCRTVALHMIRMTRVGVRYIDDLADPNSFVRAVHVTGDLEKLGQGTSGDQRCFVTIADERTILHFGSSYGGNALLGKIAHGLRQAAYDGWASGEFLAEQFMLIGITDKLTGKRYHVCGGFPSASGDAIIFGGRARDREPLIRAITDLAEGVYDGLTLGAEATFAAEGVEGLLRYDPMSMRPFMSYPEGAYAAHWLKVIGSATGQPIFAHVNWFQRDPEDGHYLWPGYRDNLRPLLWLPRLKEGEVRGRQTPVGIIPAQDELDLDGVVTTPEELKTILSIDTPRWKQEMKHREQHLEQFAGLPGEIWQAHRRVAAALDDAD